jgi:DNA-binding NtrC family response regulator
MNEEDILEGKKILIVDDEESILDSLKEILEMCVVDSALSFETAKKLIEERSYDVAILDIMGVRGYELLKIAKEKQIPAIMLTAHALSPESLMESIKEGAQAYIPKEKIADITIFIKEILEARRKGIEKPVGWFAKLKPLFDKIFGSDWMEKDTEFWDDFKRRYIDTRYL